MNFFFSRFVPCTVWLACAVSPLAAGAQPTAADIEFFEKSIRPILAARCYECHGPAEQKSKMRLDHISLVLKGGERGPALVPGDPKASTLVRAIEYLDPKLQMPPKKMLEDEEIDLLIEWVERGAPWPDEPAPSAAAAPADAFDLAKRRAEHWAWQPVRATQPPPVKQADWPRQDADKFLLARLEKEGLAPAPEADRRTLIRRLSFDLVGLPPDPAAIEAFVNDTRPDAYERLVDELLASPHFGERWGRHWLDLVRYAESYGHEGDYPIREAWRYRDYVIRSLNADVPYDRFVREHIAGDLMPDPRVNAADGTNESLLATGWWYMHQATHAPVDVEKDFADRIDNQIDVIGKAVLGMTVACARCHDHKFDAISANDYYSLGAFMRSSRQVFAYLDPQGAIGAATESIESVQRAGAATLSKSLRQSAKTVSRDVENYLGAAHEVLFGASQADDVNFVPRVDVFADFEGADYGAWTVQGAAFGTAPSRGAFENQQPVEGFEGAGLLNSFLGGDDATGTIRSPEFVIERPFIHLLVGGGRFSDGTFVAMNVDGETVRKATGRNHERLEWATWDVSEFRGKKAYLIAVDSRKGGWGHINADQIIFSDSPVPQVLARPIAAVAKDRKLDAAKLGRWMQAILSPDAAQPDHPLYPWKKLAGPGAEPLADRATDAVGDGALFETFDGPGFGGWFPDGFAFGDGATKPGAWSPNGTQDPFVSTGVAHSGLLAPELQGTLRSPSFPLDYDTIQIHAKGRGGQVRLIVGHYMLREHNPLLFDNTFLDVNSDEYQWYTMTGGLGKWPGVESYIELVDDGDGYLAVDEIRFGKSKPEKDVPEELRTRLGGVAGESGEKIAAAYAAWTTALLDASGEALLSHPAARWLGLLSGKDLVDFGRVNKERESLTGQVAKLTNGLGAPIRALAITDGTTEPAHIFIRGNTTDPGEAVARRFLEAIDGAGPLVERPAYSGRLELAERLTSDENPLFARVAVNRVWHHLFGRGLVASLDNFGVLGQAPSHPELLDHLAERFRDEGYSVKSLIRMLATSSAYRMSSQTTDRLAEQQDPTNILLHRASVRRLEAETIRDSILTVANTLNSEMYGESVLAYLSPFNNNHRRPSKSGPIDGDRRRTIYLQVQRNFLPEMQLAFDFPIPDSTVGDRTESNVPAQSLALMNDEFVAAQARAWGAAMAARTDAFDSRVREMCERAWGRVATEHELASLKAFVERQRGVYGIDAQTALGDARVWTDIGQVLFMAKEFIYIG